jgi:hypothetical protein
MSWEAHGWSLGWSGGGLSGAHPRVWITYAHLQLKRRLKEREKHLTWNTKLSHICFKRPELFLSLACFTMSSYQYPKMRGFYSECNRAADTVPLSSTALQPYSAPICTVEHRETTIDSSCNSQTSRFGSFQY